MLLAGIGEGATFDMSVSGNTVSAPGSFTCNGTWSGTTFNCTTDGCAYGGCTACGGSCNGVTWTIAAQDPDPTRTLASGDIFVGIEDSNSFSAHCHRTS
ncbi:MAG: hypothetical protein ACREJX_19110 [Polyangiaceae bacterium]